MFPTSPKRFHNPVQSTSLMGILDEKERNRKAMLEEMLRVDLGLATPQSPVANDKAGFGRR
jgi:hypothetical protein